MTRDDAEQTASAEAFVSAGAWVSTLVLAEAIWVLAAAYDIGLSGQATAVEMLLNHRELTIQDGDTVAAALALFRARPSLGFSDCLILEIARKAGHLPLGTFDRKPEQSLWRSTYLNCTEDAIGPCAGLIAKSALGQGTFLNSARHLISVSTAPTGALAGIAVGCWLGMVRSRKPRSGRRMCVFAFLLVAFLAFAGAIYQAVASRIDTQRFPRPGRLVSAGEFNINIHCAGKGSPTVVLESGLADSLDSWTRLQPEMGRGKDVGEIVTLGFMIRSPVQ